MEGATFEDLPQTLRTSEKPKKVLMPGFLKAKGEKRAQRRAEKWNQGRSPPQRSAGTASVQPTTPPKHSQGQPTSPPRTDHQTRGSPFRSNQTSWDWSSWQWSWNSWDYHRGGYRWQADPPRGDPQDDESWGTWKPENSGDPPEGDYAQWYRNPAHR